MTITYEDVLLIGGNEVAVMISGTPFAGEPQTFDYPGSGPGVDDCEVIALVGGEELYDKLSPAQLKAIEQTILEKAAEQHDDSDPCED